MNEQDKVHYDLGWDFAMYRRTIPDEASKMFCDGYRAFGHGGRRTKKNADRFIKKWLQIRWGALRRGKPFDAAVTPDFLELVSVGVDHCPVTLEKLTYGEMAPTDWSVERADNRFGYEPGNLIILSLRANKAKSDLSLEEIEAIADGDVENDALTQVEWARMAEVMRPLQYKNGHPAGVSVLYGQLVAPGTPMLPIARLQDIVGECVHGQMEPGDNDHFAILLGATEHFLCRNKLQRRAFHKLVLAARRRAKATGSTTAIWGAPRVQRLLGELISILGNDVDAIYRRIALALDKIDSEFFPEIQAMTNEYRNSLNGGDEDGSR